MQRESILEGQVSIWRTNLQKDDDVPDIADLEMACNTNCLQKVSWQLLARNALGAVLDVLAGRTDQIGCILAPTMAQGNVTAICSVCYMKANCVK